MSANPLLSIEGLTASVDEKTILHNVNLNVAAGETHVLMGPNGAGKSTLGHLVMGDPVYTVNDGRIVFDGQDITELTTDKRSRAGLFLSFQAPVEIPGVPLSSFLRASIAFLPIFVMPSAKPTETVVLPSPAGVGLMAVTRMSLARISLPTPNCMGSTFAIYCP